MIKRKKTKSGKWWRLKASATIEAAVIVPFTLLIIAAVISLVLVLHDRIIFPTAGIYEVMEEAGGEKDPEGIREAVSEVLNNRLVTAKEASVTAVETEDEISVEAEGDIRIPLWFVRSLVGEENSHIHTRIDVSNLDARKTLIRYKTICDGIDAFTKEEEE